MPKILSKEILKVTSVHEENQMKFPISSCGS